jgi:GMP reductase
MIMDDGLFFKNILLKSEKCIVGSRKECDISTEIAGKKIPSPVIPANMPSILTMDIARRFDKAGCFHIWHRLGGPKDIQDYVKQTNSEDWKFVSPSIGIKPEDFDLVNWMSDEGFRIDAITIDVAHSWQDRVEKLVYQIRSLLPFTYIIVGNGDHPDWIEWLNEMGVNCAKINIGVSSACRTREYTGFGSATVTDLCNCHQAAGHMKIMSDGGLTRLPDGDIAVGDVAKAIACGADFVLSGALFSQCKGSPALKNSYFGNSTARAKGHSSNVEGAEVKVNSCGRTIEEQIEFIKECLQSSVSYAGGKELYALRDVEAQVV